MQNNSFPQIISRVCFYCVWKSARRPTGVNSSAEVALAGEAICLFCWLHYSVISAGWRHWQFPLPLRFASPYFGCVRHFIAFPLHRVCWGRPPGGRFQPSGAREQGPQTEPPSRASFLSTLLLAMPSLASYSLSRRLRQLNTAYCCAPDFLRFNLEWLWPRDRPRVINNILNIEFDEHL